MKLFFPVFAFSASMLIHSTVLGESGDREVLYVPTAVEAADMIDAEMAAREQARANRAAAVGGVPALQEWENQNPNTRTVMRRIAPPPVRRIEPKVVPAPDADFSMPDWLVTRRAVQTISFSARVFDREVTAISWRDNDGHTWQAISNVDFNHLSGVTNIEGPDHSWMTFLFVENIDSTREQERAARAREAGIEYQPQSPPSVEFLQTEEHQYVVFAHSEDDVPEEMFLELDALHDHYHANHQKLAAAYERNKALNEARRAWHQANPPVPRDTIINFWVRP